MKEIFLSFKSEYIKPVLYGLKKYEYRRRFCSEETIAYLYLSGKVKKVIGILELGSPIRLDLTRKNYINFPETLKRIDNYIEDKVLNAIPIKSFSFFTNPLSLEEIRKNIPNFMPPQMYYILDNQPELNKLLKKLEVKPKLFIHPHDKIYYDNLALSVSEIKKSPEFKEIDSKNKF